MLKGFLHVLVKQSRMIETETNYCRGCSVTAYNACHFNWKSICPLLVQFWSISGYKYLQYNAYTSWVNITFFNFHFYYLFSLFITDVKSRITKLEDMKNLRLEFLRNKFRDTYNAVIWLRANQHLFSSPVHEPILLQVRDCTLCSPHLGDLLVVALILHFVCHMV